MPICTPSIEWLTRRLICAGCGGGWQGRGHGRQRSAAVARRPHQGRPGRRHLSIPGVQPGKPHLPPLQCPCSLSAMTLPHCSAWQQPLAPLLMIAEHAPLHTTQGGPFTQRTSIQYDLDHKSRRAMMQNIVQGTVIILRRPRHSLWRRPRCRCAPPAHR